MPRGGTEHESHHGVDPSSISHRLRAAPDGRRNADGILSEVGDFSQAESTSSIHKHELKDPQNQY
jgi:hypothetical protein